MWVAEENRLCLWNNRTCLLLRKNLSSWRKYTAPTFSNVQSVCHEWSFHSVWNLKSINFDSCNKKKTVKKEYFFFILCFSGHIWSTKVNLKGNAKLPWSGLQHKKGKMLTCWEYVRLESPVNNLVQKQHARIPSYCTVIILAIILTSRIWSHQRKKKLDISAKLGENMTFQVVHGMTIGVKSTR